MSAHFEAALEAAVELCGVDGCRLVRGHQGQHNRHPISAWAFMREADKNKLDKAGFATPRGGAKGAYQNHVVRANKVIVPYEKLTIAPLERFLDGYVVRLFPEQYFESAGHPKQEFLSADSPVRVGENAFVLYRSQSSLEQLPPLGGWRSRRLFRGEEEVGNRRGSFEEDGHFVVRIPPSGARPGTSLGPPQGIFAPEYADTNTNFLCRCVLAWLIVHTVNSPYTTTMAGHLKAILAAECLLNDDVWEYRGVIRHALTACPLCTRLLSYSQLHEMLVLDDEEGLENAGVQIAGATRSTVVNLFHLEPLRYDRLDHVPESVAWGHATCNTKLGQRRCYSVAELTESGYKVGLIREEGVETIGWMSPGWEMIRSPMGAVWIRISVDRGDEDVDPGEVEGQTAQAVEAQ